MIVMNKCGMEPRDMTTGECTSRVPCVTRFPILLSRASVSHIQASAAFVETSLEGGCSDGYTSLQ